MTTKLDEKLALLSDWYDDFINDNKLLILVEGSEHLQNILDASAINVNIWSDDRYSVVLSSKKFGLYHIEIFLASPYHISLKPFIDFSTRTLERYVEIRIRDDFFTSGANRIDMEGFLDSDLEILEKMFKPHIKKMISLIQSVENTRKEFLNYKANKLSASLGKSFVFDISNDSYYKLSSDMEQEFLDKHSQDIKITKEIMQFLK